MDSSQRTHRLNSGRYLAAAWSLLIFLLLVLCVHITHGTQETVSNYLNGDALFPAHLSQDVLIEGGQLDGWRAPPAPFVFPDWLIAGVLVSVTGQAVLANLGFAVINTIILAVALAASIRIAGGPFARARETVLVLGLATMVLCTIWEVSPALRYLFLPAFHAGTVSFSAVVVALVLYFVYRQPRKTAAWATLSAITIICFLLGFSDLLTIGYLAAPLTAAMIFSACRMRTWPGSRFYVACIATWIPIAVGAKSTRHFIHYQDPNSSSSLAVDNVLTNISVFCSGALSHLQDLDLLHWGSLVASFACALFLFMRQSSAVDSSVSTRISTGECTGAHLSLLLFATLSVWSIMSMIVFGGSRVLWLDRSYDFSVHYWLPSIYVPFVVVPLVITSIFASRDLTGRVPSRRFVLAPAVAITCLTMASIGSLFIKASKPQTVALIDHRPEYVRILDEVAKEYDLSAGFVDYWDAREIGVFSEMGVKALPAYGDPIQYFHWMSNNQWRSRRVPSNDPTPRIDFVMTGGDKAITFTPESVQRWLGNAQAIIDLDGRTDATARKILIYKPLPGQPGIEPLVYGRCPPLENEGATVQFAMSQFSSQVGRVENGTRIADASSDQPGYLAFGPYTRIGPGRYRIDSDIAAAGQSLDKVSYWDLGFVDSNINEFVVLGKNQIANNDYEQTHEFTISEDYPAVALEFRVYFQGSGVLRLNRVGVTRLPDHGELANSNERQSVTR